MLKAGRWGWRQKVAAGYAAFALFLVALSAISPTGPYGSQGSQVAGTFALVVFIPVLAGILSRRPAPAPSPAGTAQSRSGPIPREQRRPVWEGDDGGACSAGQPSTSSTTTSSPRPGVVPPHWTTGSSSLSHTLRERTPLGALLGDSMRPIDAAMAEFDTEASRSWAGAHRGEPHGWA